jgi:hypothetical protein
LAISSRVAVGQAFIDEFFTKETFAESAKRSSASSVHRSPVELSELPAQPLNNMEITSARREKRINVFEL